MPRRRLSGTVPLDRSADMQRLAAPGCERVDWLAPSDWPAAVGACMTTRSGGSSRAPYDGFNLHLNVGDDPTAVVANRRAYAQAIGATPVYLDQVHGVDVACLGAADLAPDAAPHRADAAVTGTPGIACTVLVADCLPVLFAAPDARAVGAAHGGWRGLASGVVENTIAALCEMGSCEPEALCAWLGVSIGPTRFEVGRDVVEAFDESPDGPEIRRFAAVAPGKWHADLRGLAADRLHAAGVGRISAASGCSFDDRSRFFSFRRDRVTGRMAASVWIRGTAV